MQLGTTGNRTHHVILQSQLVRLRSILQLCSLNILPTRCQGAVFEAEKIVIKDETYHKRCFNCRRCARALDSLTVAVAPDADIYCKVKTNRLVSSNGICVNPSDLK